VGRPTRNRVDRRHHTGRHHTRRVHHHAPVDTAVFDPWADTTTAPPAAGSTRDTTPGDTTVGGSTTPRRHDDLPPMERHHHPRRHHTRRVHHPPQTRRPSTRGPTSPHLTDGGTRTRYRDHDPDPGGDPRPGRDRDEGQVHPATAAVIARGVAVLRTQLPRGGSSAQLQRLYDCGYLYPLLVLFPRTSTELGTPARDSGRVRPDRRENRRTPALCPAPRDTEHQRHVDHQQPHAPGPDIWLSRQ
jgi:hypothetical protein